MNEADDQRATDRPTPSDPAWSAEDWVTAEVPVLEETSAALAEQEDDLVQALLAALDHEPVRVRRVVDAIVAELERGLRPR